MKANETKIESSVILAGGCFWGVEELIRKEVGVIDTEVGYSGGHTNNPIYETVKTGITGHAEAIRVTFDPSKTNYEKLFHFFFSIHDPTTRDRQGNDKGSQYRSAIFYQNENEKEAALRVIRQVKEAGYWSQPIVTEVTPFTGFFSAESYHQDYLQKHPGGYTCHFKRY